MAHWSSEIWYRHKNMDDFFSPSVGSPSFSFLLPTCVTVGQTHGDGVTVGSTARVFLSHNVLLTQTVLLTAAQGSLDDAVGRIDGAETVLEGVEGSTVDVVSRVSQ